MKNNMWYQIEKNPLKSFYNGGTMELRNDLAENVVYFVTFTNGGKYYAGV